MFGSDDPVPAGRRWKQLAGGLLAAEVALTAPSALAESAIATQPNGSASARLAFRIVIPSIVVVDTRTGIVYSNDARGLRAVPGATHVVRRDGMPGPGFRPVGRAGIHLGHDVLALP